MFDEQYIKQKGVVMKMKILGTGYSLCNVLCKATKVALKYKNIDAEQKRRGHHENLKYGSISLSAIAIDGNIFAQRGNNKKMKLSKY